MQKHDEQAGFVSLSGGWRCSECGGWVEGGSRCGCSDECHQGKVYTSSRQSRGCGCDECVETSGGSRSAACCEHNTTLRNERSGDGCSSCNDNGDSAYTTRRSDCKSCDDNGDNAYATRRSDCKSCDDNGDSAYVTRRSGCKSCDDNGDNAYATRRSGCKSCNDNGDNAYTARRNSRVGIVWAEEQKLGDVFESESALRTGTLFPELHKPLNGYCPRDWNCACDAQEASFAAWELRLYLNTHPDDQRALKLFRQLCSETEAPSYATSFLTDDGCTNRWSWVDDPWPWECKANAR